MTTFFDLSINYFLFEPNPALPRCIGSGARWAPVLATVWRDPGLFPFCLRPQPPCSLGGAPNLLTITGASPGLQDSLYRGEHVGQGREQYDHTILGWQF